MDLSRDFVCPLSLDLMTDPVMLVETGEIFERSAIQGWFDRGNATDPWTRRPLASTRLVPVRLLRRLVEDWVEQRKQQQRDEEEQEATRAMLGVLEDDSVVFIPPARLTLGREIGRGGMGVVRAAILHPSEKETVAVKMLPLPVLSQDASVAFRREVKVLQRGSNFCHNVCRFLGVTKLENHLCIVMFKYEQSLDDAIKAERENFAKQGVPVVSRKDQSPNTCIPYPRLLLLAQDVCLAMADLHRQHIIVQDLKPGNVLIDAYGRAVVADFGISHAVEHTLSARKATSIAGSVNYMAPEQHDPDETASGVTTQADAWAFGCLLMAMATGQDPWEGLQMRQVVTNVLVRRQTPPVPDVLPEGLQDMVRRCFSFDPADRPTFDEMLVVLREAWGQQSQRQPGGAAPAAAAPSQADMLQSWGERPSHVLDWLGLRSQSTSQGSQAIQQQLHASCQQQLQALRLEGMAWHEKELKAMRDELAAVKQKLVNEELARTKLELELVKAKAQVAAKKEKSAVEKWLETYRCTNSKSTPLHMAAQIGRLDVVKHLIEFGIDIDASDRSDHTPLILAVINGHLDVVKCLVEAGAQVNVREYESHEDGNWSWPALYVAVVEGFSGIVEVLLAAGADVNESARHGRATGDTALHVATDLDMVRSLLRMRGVKVDAVRITRIPETPLLVSLKSRRWNVAALLLKAGAVISAEGSGTAAMEAIVENEVLVKLMLEKGADVTKLGPCLYAAVEKASMPVVDVLLRAGVSGDAYRSNITVKDCKHSKFTETALHVAIRASNVALVQQLLQAGARSDSIRRGEKIGPYYATSEPALFTAVQSGNVEIVKCLVRAGADVLKSSFRGFSLGMGSTTTILEEARHSPEMMDALGLSKLTAGQLEMYRGN
eukprot:jgi/Mesvir1/16892/Mv15769-RA.1